MTTIPEIKLLSGIKPTKVKKVFPKLTFWDTIKVWKKGHYIKLFL